LAALGLQMVAVRLDWTADTQSHAKLQVLRVQTGYALSLAAAPVEKSETILSYQGSQDHDHLVTLDMRNATLAKETQALLALSTAPSGRLLYAADAEQKQKKTGKPCLAAISVDFLNEPAAAPRSVFIYPPQPGEFKRLDRLRTVHLRSNSPLIVRVSANSQDGETGPNCRNLLTIGTWEQAIGKDLQVAFVAAPASEIGLKVLSDPREAASFRRGASELEPLELEPLHPLRLQVLTVDGSRVQQVRERAGEPFMTLTHLQLGGDFLVFDMSGLVGLPVGDLLGGWKWPIFAALDAPLFVWLWRSWRRVKVHGQQDASTVQVALGEKKRIFPSYSWGDKERVMQIHDKLEVLGCEPWIESRRNPRWRGLGVVYQTPASPEPAGGCIPVESVTRETRFCVGGNSHGGSNRRGTTRG
jgi:hypothetical protein